MKETKQASGHPEAHGAVRLGMARSLFGLFHDVSGVKAPVFGAA